MKYKIISLIFLGSIAGAQAPQPSENPGTLQFKLVKSVPFSAKVVTESNRILSDGSHIIDTNSAIIARDSDGRTLREQTLPKADIESAATESILFIVDPMADVAYLLDPRSRLARKWPVSAGPETDYAQSQDRKLGSKSNLVNIKIESMGTQLIEGLQVEGTRVTRTLAVGEVGNDAPLEVVSETWYSAELQTIVLNKTTDPRLGRTTSRLTEILRLEPDHSLFEIPPTYTVRVESAPRKLDKVKQ